MAIQGLQRGPQAEARREGRLGGGGGGVAISEIGTDTGCTKLVPVSQSRPSSLLPGGALQPVYSH